MQSALSLLILAVIGADESPSRVQPPVTLPVICKPRTGEATEPTIWKLSMPEAIRISLDKAETVRIISTGGSTGECDAGCTVEGKAPTPLQISRVSAATNPWQFKSEVMAHIRSVEQQYWSLAQQYTQLNAAEKAAELAEAVLKREQSALESGRGTVADVAEAQQRLEQFRLDLVTKTSDVITTERQLRKILGLPASDNRRIVPTSAPREDRREEDWDDSRDQMMASQPDIIRQREVVSTAEEVAQVARDWGWLAEGEAEGAALACVRQALETARRQREYLEQVVHQSTHSLARFFLEVDTNYKQFQTAARLRSAAAQRLEAQQAFYEEGRITIDRYFDAVSQYVSARALEAQYKTAYNVAIIALEEARGTLLKARNIQVVDAPRPCPADLGRSIANRGDSDPAVVPASHEHEDASPRATGDADGSATTLKFELSVGGKHPRLIRGELKITPRKTAPGKSVSTPGCNP
jgi:hypothetical protein